MKKNASPAGGDISLISPVRLPLSSSTVNHVASLIRGHRKQIRSRWRALNDGRIAVIVLAHLRNDERLADLAGGASVSPSTVRRWVLEVIGLLAARSPRLDRALAKVVKDGGCVALLDGTLIRTRRRTGRANRKNFSGKHKAHGLLLLALTDAKGRLLWVSSARRGACSEITAPATRGCAPGCASSSWERSPTWASSAWTTATASSRRSSPGSRRAAASPSPRRRRS
ncbi:transposase family protein [Kitasatospora sp. NPDC050463]|uniref:transposase family protein n=1 Tax=Kitasatospora sp. NPDC050463 TaxID=3155786 RepID=UPI0033E79B4E